MSKNRKNKKKRNQATQSVTTTVVTSEVIDDIVDELSNEVIDMEAKEVAAPKIHKGGEKVITGAKIKSTGKKSKSLLESIGKKMSEAPEYNKEQKVAGNQANVSTEQEERNDTETAIIEVENEDEKEIKIMMDIFTPLYISINGNLLKHGIDNKLPLGDVIKLFSGDTEHIDIAVKNLTKCSINVSNFDGKICGLILDLKFTLISWIETVLLPLMEKKAPDKLTPVKGVLEKIKAIKKSNYKTVLSDNFDIDIDKLFGKEQKVAGNQGTISSKKKEEKTEKAETNKRDKKVTDDGRKFVHEFSVDEVLPKDTRIMSAAWYTVHNYSTERYMSDLKRVQSL